jgi:hypothetical protein
MILDEINGIIPQNGEMDYISLHNSEEYVYGFQIIVF